MQNTAAAVSSSLHWLGGHCLTIYGIESFFVKFSVEMM